MPFKVVVKLMQSHADHCIFSYLSGAIQAFRGQIVASAVHIQDVRRGTELGLLSASATHNRVACSVRKVCRHTVVTKCLVVA